MKVQDLRVGNLVEQGEVLGIVNCRVFVGAEAIHVSNIKPIPLTEQRLIEFGFVKGDDILDYKNVYYFKSCWVSLDYYYNVGFDWVDETAIMCYETLYIHQLQNLYYSLTNKEL